MNLSLADLEDKGPVLEGGDLVVREVEAVKGLVELEAVRDGGHLGVVDGEAGDVRVEGDGEGDQAGVGAHHTQLHIVTLASYVRSKLGSLNIY